jgi:hypothetical protein
MDLQDDLPRGAEMTTYAAYVAIVPKSEMKYSEELRSMVSMRPDGRPYAPLRSLEEVNDLLLRHDGALFPPPNDLEPGDTVYAVPRFLGAAGPSASETWAEVGWVVVRSLAEHERRIDGLPSYVAEIHAFAGSL